MDRQRVTVLGAVGAVIALALLAVGVVVGRASAGDTDASDSDSSSISTDSDDGLPAGPTAMDDGVPVGFARTEDGVLGAAISWVPWLVSSPASERPDGIDAVLAAGVEPPMPDGISERLQFVPWAARVSMAAQDEATVTLLGTPLRGEVGSDLDGGIWPLEATLVWDDGAEGWRVSSVDTDAQILEVPIQAEDVSGYRVLRSYGGVLAGPLMEEVPGD